MLIFLLVLLFGISFFFSVKKLIVIANSEGFLENCIYAVIYCIAWVIPFALSIFAFPKHDPNIDDFGILLFLIPSVTIIVLFVYCWYRLGQCYPKFYLPAYFFGILCTIGLTALALGMRINNYNNAMNANTNNNNNNVNNDNNGQTFVDPHHVDGYTKADGTYVRDYWRDGNGDSNIDLTKEQGGGYYRDK